jgi:predicted ester cyclase
MSVEWNKAVVRRLIEGFNEWDIPVLEALFAKNVVDHNPAPDQQAGFPGIMDTYTAWRAAFPDLHITIEDTIGEGNKVVLRTLIRGTRQGALTGMSAVGKRCLIAGTIICYLRDGKVVEWWHNDGLAALIQEADTTTASRDLACGVIRNAPSDLSV